MPPIDPAQNPPPPPPPPPPPDPNAALIAEAARLNAQAAVATAETARLNALAAKNKATIEGIGLPSFEGKTTLNAGAGAIEALLLATGAIAKAAQEIADAALGLNWPDKSPYTGNFLLFAGDESADFNQLAGIRAEIGIFKEIFDSVLNSAIETRVALIDGLSGTVAAISAVAGLFRSETEVSAVDHPAISHRVLATAVAARMPGRAIFPGARNGALPQGSKPAVVLSLMTLTEDRDRALAAATSPPQGAALPPETAERIKAAVTRFDAFFARVTTPDSAGIVPLAHAAQLEQMTAGNGLALRVYVEKAGGSLVNYKNIKTFIGFDPVRVSGGLVASYAVTDPTDGRVLAAGVLDCRTKQGKLRDIQRGA